MKKPKNPLHQLTRLVICSTLCLLITHTGIAEPNQQSGEIVLEAEEKGNSPEMIQAQGIEYIQGIFNEIKSGKLPSPTTLDSKKLNYLASVYLYCTLTNGTCPLPLEALLELDLLHAHSNKNSQCPILTQFWTYWLKNNYEKLVEYNLKTGHMSAASRFKKDVRPRYVRCQETVSDILGQTATAPGGFSARFAEGGTGQKTLSNFLDFLKLIKQNNINVFATTTSSATK